MLCIYADVFCVSATNAPEDRQANAPEHGWGKEVKRVPEQAQVHHTHTHTQTHTHTHTHTQAELSHEHNNAATAAAVFAASHFLPHLLPSPIALHKILETSFILARPSRARARAPCKFLIAGRHPEKQ